MLSSVSHKTNQQDQKDLLTTAEYLHAGFSRARQNAAASRKPPSKTNASEPSYYDFGRTDEISARLLSIDRPKSGKISNESHLPVMSSKRPLTAREREPEWDMVDAGKMFDFTCKFLEEHGILDTEPTTKNNQNSKKDIVPETIVRADSSAVRFGEDDPEFLHDKFMKNVSEILQQGVSRPGTAISHQRPRTATSKRSKSPGTHSSIEFKPGPLSEPTEKSRPNTSMSRQRPKTAPVVSGTRRGRKITDEEAKIVVEFLQKTQIVSRIRQHRPKTLADWKLEDQSRDRVWDANAFSVQSFMSEYIKSRTEAETSKIAKRQNSKLLPTVKSCDTINDPSVKRALTRPSTSQGKII